MKLLAFYVIVFGIVGVLLQLDAGLRDLDHQGRFFQRSSPWSFVAAFFVTPLFALMSFAVSVVRMQVFAPDVIELHLMIIVFFALAIFGLFKQSRFIVLVAALLPIIWVILDLDLIRYIQVKYAP